MNGVVERLYETKSFLQVSEILQNTLYFVTVRHINNGGSCDAFIPSTADLHFFTTDNEFIYHNFYGDFGPLNLSTLYKFCRKMLNKMAAYANNTFYDRYMNSRLGKAETVDKMKLKFVKRKVLVYYTSTNMEKRANAAFLVSSFALLYLGLSPRQAYRALQPMKMKYRPFQDASIGASPYKITLKDCLDGLHKASVFGFFNFNDFSVGECVYYENIDHGDVSWIVPQKFLAFPGPVDSPNEMYHPPLFYIEYFLTNNVTDVVRLNQRAYDSRSFTRFNIRHHDLYMQDGSDPPESVLRNFLAIAESAKGAVAVHCKAGLGRTGTLIGAYLIKHYRMSAKEVVAWVRICRPGSIIGHQQSWLEDHEENLWYEGNEWRYKAFGRTEIVPFLPFGVYSQSSPKRQYAGLRELINMLRQKTKCRYVKGNQKMKSKLRIKNLIATTLQNAKLVDPKDKQLPKQLKSAMKIVPEIIPIDEEEFKGLGKMKMASEQTLCSEPVGMRELETLRARVCESHTGAPVDRPSSRAPLSRLSSDTQPFRGPPVSPQDTEEQPECFPVGPQFSSYSSGPQMTYGQDASDPTPKISVERQMEVTQLISSYQNQLQRLQQQLEDYGTRMGRSRAGEAVPAQYQPPFLHQKNSDYFNPNFNTCRRLSNPNSPTNSDYSAPVAAQPNRPPVRQTKVDKQPKHVQDLACKSVDRNWRAHRMRLRSQDQNKEEVMANYSYDDMVCAFDSRADCEAKYGRINKTFLEQPPQPTLVQRDQPLKHKPAAPTRHQEMKKRAKAATGLLLSPEDLQSWMGALQEKPDTMTQGDRLNEMKRLKRKD